MREGDWMQTYSGRQFWPLDPRPEEVFVEDIAHGLSMMCRYNGQCRRFYSVAEHSWLMSFHVPPLDALWALLHDGTEAYIADIIRPVKPFLVGYRAIETKLMTAICVRFGLPVEMPASVKRADNAILVDERDQIMAKPPSDWKFTEAALGVEICGFGPGLIERMFLDRFMALTPAGN